MGNVWLKVAQADIARAEGGSGVAIPDGVYSATVLSATPTVFKKGSTGVIVTYLIDDGEYKGKKINDYIVMELADGRDFEKGISQLKKLQTGAGLTQKEIDNFKYPVDANGKLTGQLGDFKKLIDAPFLIHVKGEPSKDPLHKGKVFPRVEKFNGREQVL